jgi:5'-methylthioinosine phosphorylase
MNGGEFIFLHRHGFGHTLTPHQINYRANLWALKQLDVTHIIAVSAVGGITENMTPGKIVFPDQLIDYTYSRKHTYYDDKSKPVVHVDFTKPYDEALRLILINDIQKTNLAYEPAGVYGVTQGPRLESAAEIKRLESDGCDIVGMTGMPETGLARELGISYACCAVVVNAAAGKNGDAIITMEIIKQNLALGMESVRELLTKTLLDITRLP